MNIVFFYSEVMGYTLAVIKSLVKDHGAQVHLVCWDKGTRSAFERPPVEGVFYYKRSEMNTIQLEELLERLSPRLLYVSGRMDSGYLKASLKARCKGTLVVSGFDAQWKPSLKNHIISLASYWLYRKYFDFIWIPGPYQYEFAKKLGFSEERIIWNLYSADTDLFTLKTNQDVLNKRFVFTGRFSVEKGIQLLVEAFENSKKIRPHDWELLLIGNGPLQDSIGSHENVTIVNFLQPQQLLEKMEEGGVFVLPSVEEPWGVVIHEYAVAGFPIIASDACGAAVSFVKNNYNGFVVEAGNVDSLTEAMLKMVNLLPPQLLEMKAHSRALGKSITPFISSSSLVAVLKNKNKDRLYK